MIFVDTNILLYAISKAPEEAGKAAKARAILERTDLALSSQVLQEFYVQATHSRRPDPLSHEHARAFVESFHLRFPVQSITPVLVLAAIDIRQRFQVSFWDAAILEAARLMSCSVVLSEDLGHGQSYGSVTVENPFRE